MSASRSTMVIDPLHVEPGESRCRHDMLAGQCSWCRGLPDVPVEFVDWPNDKPQPTTPRLRWGQAERYALCGRCGEPIRPGALVAWSPTDAGVIGECCEEQP